jgi:photosystem II stability/assembly factor-like uncharacterized protein
VDPTAPNTLYAAGVNGAVYKSEDGGAAWTPGEPLVRPYCPISDLLVDATGDPAVYASTCQGVYKSSDAGSTWLQASGGIVSDTQRLVQSPHAPGLLLVSDSNGQVYRSNDGATTWQAISMGLPGRPAYGLAISGPETCWAVLSSSPGAPNLYRFEAGYWSAVPLNLPPQASVNSLLVDPADPSAIFVSITDASDDKFYTGYLLRSSDDGLTWTPLHDDGSTHPLALTPSRILGKDPNSGALYAETAYGLWASPDEGATWDMVELSLDRPSPVLSQIVFDGATLYLALGGTIAKSEDGGRTWREVNQGLNNASQALIAPHPTDPATLYAVPSAAMTQVLQSSDYGESWTRLTPGDAYPLPLERQPNALFVDPNPPHTLYLTTETARAFRSDDGGASWSSVWSDFRFSSVPALAAAPSEPNVLYASQNGFGPLRSDDGGNTWRPLHAGTNDALALAVHPEDANFVLSGDVRQSFETTATLRRSRDGGATWEAVLELPQATAITSVAFDPRVEPYFRYGTRPADPTRLYAASAGPRGALWFSNDAGDSWKPLNRDLNFSSVHALAVSAHRPGVAYAGVWGGGTWRTDDGGASWRRVPGDPATSPAGIAMDPSNYNVVYIADGTAPRLYRSTDDGNTWQVVLDAGPDYARMVTLALAPSDPSLLYVSALKHDGRGALLRFDANAPQGENVSDITGELPGAPLGLAVHRYDAWRVFATPQGGGLYKSMDGGDSWRHIQGGLPQASFYHVVEDPFWPNLVYLAGGASTEPFDPDAVYGVWKSEDDGNTWRKVGGTTFGRDSGPMRSIAFPPGNQEVMYAAGEGGVYLSPDRGETWSNVTGRIPFASTNVVATDGQAVYAGSAGGGLFAGTIHPLIHTANWSDASALAIPVAHAQLTLDPADPQTLYASTYPGGVFKSSDGGMTWRERNAGLPSFAVADPARQGRYALAVAPGDAQVLYAGMHAHGVYRSDDGGGSWRPAHGDEGELRGADVEALLVHPDSPDTVYAATGRGVWRTVNGGHRWAEFGPGTTGNDIVVRALALGSDGQLYAGTSGHGVFARHAYHQAEGDVWRQSSGALEPWEYRERRISLLSQPGDSNTLYATAFPGGLYKTTDGGQSWRELDVGLGSAGVLSLFAHPEDARVLYAGTTSGLRRSDDGGETWHLWNAGWPVGQWVTGVAFVPQAPDVMYACSQGDEGRETKDERGGAVMKSVDGGETWVEMMRGLDLGQGFYEVLVDRFDEEVVYVVTEREGVFVSRDGGATWGEWNEGLWSREAGGMMGGLWVSADGRLVFFGTEGTGVWRRPAVGGP